MATRPKKEYNWEQIAESFLNRFPDIDKVYDRSSFNRAIKRWFDKDGKHNNFADEVISQDLIWDNPQVRKKINETRKGKGLNTIEEATQITKGKNFFFIRKGRRFTVPRDDIKQDKKPIRGVKRYRYKGKFVKFEVLK